MSVVRFEIAVEGAMIIILLDDACQVDAIMTRGEVTASHSGYGLGLTSGDHHGAQNIQLQGDQPSSSRSYLYDIHNKCSVVSETGRNTSR
jgi:hypothetical protein